MPKLPSITFKQLILYAALTILVGWCLTFYLVSRPPSHFPSGIIIDVPKNSSLTNVANDLVQKGAIRSAFLFKIGVVLFHGRKGIQAGDYLLYGAQNVFTIALRMAQGDQGLTHISVTIPEGTNVYDMAFILLRNIPGFDAPYFVRIAHGDEGYLFPDTYYFLPNVTPEEVVSAMSANFNQKIQTLAPDIAAFKKPLRDDVIMASILEEEARTTKDREIISGILWKRLDQGILLQVDAPLVYIIQNTMGKVSLDDTKIDSPYNTYKYKGLPIGPISNPGLDALSAAVHPTSTPYYYYLSDAKGNMHYAVTFEQHEENREKYLQ